MHARLILTAVLLGGLIAACAKSSSGDGGESPAAPPSASRELTPSGSPTPPPTGASAAIDAGGTTIPSVNGGIASYVNVEYKGRLIWAGNSAWNYEDELHDIADSACRLLGHRKADMFETALASAQSNRGAWEISREGDKVSAHEVMFPVLGPSDLIYSRLDCLK